MILNLRIVISITRIRRDCSNLDNALRGIVIMQICRIVANILSFFNKRINELL